MLIGIPKEKKNHEYRMAATPAMVRQLVEDGHEVIVEKNAGTMIGFTDHLFKEAGAKIATKAKEFFEAESDLITTKRS